MSHRATATAKPPVPNSSCHGDASAAVTQLCTDAADQSLEQLQSQNAMLRAQIQAVESAFGAARAINRELERQLAQAQLLSPQEQIQHTAHQMLALVLPLLPPSALHLVHRQLVEGQLELERQHQAKCAELKQQHTLECENIHRDNAIQCALKLKCEAECEDLKRQHAEQCEHYSLVETQVRNSLAAECEDACERMREECNQEFAAELMSLSAQLAEANARADSVTQALGRSQEQLAAVKADSVCFKLQLNQARIELQLLSDGSTRDEDRVTIQLKAWKQAHNELSQEVALIEQKLHQSTVQLQLSQAQAKGADAMKFALRSYEVPESPSSLSAVSIEIKNAALTAEVDALKSVLEHQFRKLRTTTNNQGEVIHLRAELAALASSELTRHQDQVGDSTEVSKVAAAEAARASMATDVSRLALELKSYQIKGYTLAAEGAKLAILLKGADQTLKTLMHIVEQQIEAGQEASVAQVASSVELHELRAMFQCGQQPSSTVGARDCYSYEDLEHEVVALTLALDQKSSAEKLLKQELEQVLKDAAKWRWLQQNQGLMVPHAEVMAAQNTSQLLEQGLTQALVANQEAFESDLSQLTVLRNAITESRADAAFARAELNSLTLQMSTSDPDGNTDRAHKSEIAAKVTQKDELSRIMDSPEKFRTISDAFTQMLDVDSSKVSIGLLKEEFPKLAMKLDLPQDTAGLEGVSRFLSSLEGEVSKVSFPQYEQLLRRCLGVFCPVKSAVDKSCDEPGVGQVKTPDSKASLWKEISHRLEIWDLQQQLVDAKAACDGLQQALEVAHTNADYEAQLAEDSFLQLGQTKDMLKKSEHMLQLVAFELEESRTDLEQTKDMMHQGEQKFQLIMLELEESRADLARSLAQRTDHLSQIRILQAKMDQEQAEKKQLKADVQCYEAELGNTSDELAVVLHRQVQSCYESIVAWCDGQIPCWQDLITLHACDACGVLKRFNLVDQELSSYQWASFCAQMEVEHGAALTRSFLWHLEATARYVPDTHGALLPVDSDAIYAMCCDPNSTRSGGVALYSHIVLSHGGDSEGFLASLGCDDNGFVQLNEWNRWLDIMKQEHSACAVVRLLCSMRATLKPSDAKLAVQSAGLDATFVPHTPRIAERHHAALTIQSAYRGNIARLGAALISLQNSRTPNTERVPELNSLKLGDDKEAHIKLPVERENFESLAGSVDVNMIVSSFGLAKFQELDSGYQGFLQGHELDMLIAHILAQLAKPGCSPELIVHDSARVMEMCGDSKVSFEGLRLLFKRLHHCVRS